MYRHVLIPVDCSPETRHAVADLAAFLAPLVPCQITLIAATSPSINEEQRRDKVHHAREALQTIGDIFFETGVYTRRRVIENVADGDLAVATALESRRPEGTYDLILLSTHQTRQIDFDLPFIGSIADRICSRVKVPVLVLPIQNKGRLEMTKGSVE